VGLGISKENTRPVFGLNGELINMPGCDKEYWQFILFARTAHNLLQIHDVNFIAIINHVFGK